MRRKMRTILENPSAQKILVFISNFRHPRGGAPSLHEICEGCHISMGYASRLVKKLSVEGHLNKDGRRWRGADVPDRAQIEEVERTRRARLRMMKDK